MDAAAALVPPKRKGAEAPELWLDAGGGPAIKMRRLDAEVPPVAPGAAAPPPPQPPFGVEEVLKRKAAEAPELWLDAGGGPATKMRRLDAEVPPVVPGAGLAAGPPQAPFVVEEVPMCGGEAAPAVAVGVAPAAANDERAMVVYQPAEAARSLLLGPLRPGTSLSVNPDWIHGLKSTVLQEASIHRAMFEALPARDENLNLALVPWAPSQSSSAAAAASTAPGAEMMDADQDGDGASMEVEHEGAVQPAPAAAAGAGAQGEAFHHQQQGPPQHCMAQQQQLQLPAATSRAR